MGFLLTGGLLAAAVAAVALLPVKPCESCTGVGRVTYGEYRTLYAYVFRQTWSAEVGRGLRDDSYWSCDHCSGRGRIPLTKSSPSLLVPGRPIPCWEDDICPLVAQLRSLVPPAAIR